jgi:hypothetical protein
MMACAIYVFTVNNEKNAITITLISIAVPCRIIKCWETLIFIPNYCLSASFLKKRRIFHLHFIIMIPLGNPYCTEARNGVNKTR